MRMIDLKGRRFGRLLVLRRQGSIGNRPAWLCSCNCGGRKVIRGQTLVQGLTKSCGCLAVEVSRQHDNKARKHGMSGSPEFRAWRHIIYRCTKPSAKFYSHYGARGITVCDRWRYGEGGKTPFECFFEDVGGKPSPKHSIDRIDNDGNYEPGNCRWATKDVQANNKRNTSYITIGNATKPLTVWAREYGISSSKFKDRLRSGWNPLLALEAGPHLKPGPMKKEHKARDAAP